MVRLGEMNPRPRLDDEIRGNWPDEAIAPVAACCRPKCETGQEATEELVFLDGQMLSAMVLRRCVVDGRRVWHSCHDMTGCDMPSEIASRWMDWMPG